MLPLCASASRKCFLYIIEYLLIVRLFITIAYGHAWDKALSSNSITIVTWNWVCRLFIPLVFLEFCSKEFSWLADTDPAAENPCMSEYAKTSTLPLFSDVFPTATLTGRVWWTHHPTRISAFLALLKCEVFMSSSLEMFMLPSFSVKDLPDRRRPPLPASDPG